MSRSQAQRRAKASVPPVRQRASDTLWAARLQSAIHPLWVSSWFRLPICWIAAFALYRDVLQAFPIYDDIAVHLAVDPKLGHGWFECFTVFDTGFYRPLPRLLFKLHHAIFGLESWTHHFVPLMLHGSCAAAAGWLAQVVTASAGLGWLAAALALAHPAAFDGAAHLSNSCDTMMALGVVVACGCWCRWLAQPERKWLVLTVAAWVFALLSKETAVMFAGMAPLWLAFQRVNNKRTRIAIWSFVLISALAICGILFEQNHAMLSYSNNAGFVRDPGSYLLRFSDYWTMLLLPMFNALDWTSLLLDPLYITVRVATALVIFAAIYGLACGRQRTTRAVSLNILCAVLVLMPGSMVGSLGRMMYAGTLFVSVAAAISVSANSRLSVRSLLTCGFLALVLSANYMLRDSKSYRYYLTTSDEWRNFVAELGNESKDWQPMAHVSIYSGPRYGGRVTIPENYAFTTLRVYYPDALADIMANRLDSSLQYIYRFNGSRLDLTSYRLRTDDGFTSWTIIRKPTKRRPGGG